jgi:hypothetical protein
MLGAKSWLVEPMLGNGIAVGSKQMIDDGMGFGRGGAL